MHDFFRRKRKGAPVPRAREVCDYTSHDAIYTYVKAETNEN